MRTLVLSISALSLLTACGAPMHSAKPGALGQQTSSSQTVVEDAYTRGTKAYNQNCAGCHQTFSASTKKGADFASISNAINFVPTMAGLKPLPIQTLQDIAFALSRDASPVPVPVPTPAPEPDSWARLQSKTCAPAGVARDLRILDPSQYRDVIQDVFGYTVNTASFPSDSDDFYLPDSASGGSGVRDLLHLDVLYSAAEATAAYATNNLAQTGARFSSCTQSQRSCQDQIALAILSRLFRKRLLATDADAATILARFADIADFKTRLQSIVTAALMAPNFLYIAEFKPGFRATPLTQDTLRDLDDYELASRLSFFIWNSVPDDQLLSLAQNKTLSQTAVLKAQVQRLLADGKSQRFARKFTGEWLKLGSLTTSTQLSSALLSRFRTETETVVQDHMSRNLDLRRLFDADTTFADVTLAAHYGITGISGSAFTSARRPQSELHGGLLAHASLSALTSKNTTDPIHRGLFAYQRFLCGKMGNPPAEAAMVVIEGTKYQQMVGRSNISSCNSCHAKFEPMGYAFEMLSPLGKFRTADETGAPIGQTVKLENGANIRSIQELGRELAADSRTGFCMSQNLSKFALRSNYVSTAATQCQSEQITFQAFKAGNNIKAYVEAVVFSSLFSRKLETK
jgi:hypothetical protein